MRASCFPELDLFSFPIDELLKNKKISTLYSDKFIKNVVVNFYHKFLLDESKKSELIQKMISDLIDKSAKDSRFSGVDRR